MLQVRHSFAFPNVSRTTVRNLVPLGSVLVFAANQLIALRGNEGCYLPHVGRAKAELLHQPRPGSVSVAGSEPKVGVDGLRKVIANHYLHEILNDFILAMQRTENLLTVLLLLVEYVMDFKAQFRICV